MFVPKYYQKLKNLPEDPPECEVYGISTEGFESVIKVFPISKESLMSLDENFVRKAIHNYLGNDQGLIECEKVTTSSNKDVIYSIVKTMMKPCGVSYFLRVHIYDDNKPLEINVFTLEKGLTGARDSMVFELLRRKYKNSDEVINLWREDPYDKEYKKGALMNKSEQKKFDELFPNHPLSEARRLVDLMIENL